MDCKKVQSIAVPMIYVESLAKTTRPPLLQLCMALRMPSESSPPETGTTHSLLRAFGDGKGTRGCIGLGVTVGRVEPMQWGLPLPLHPLTTSLSLPCPLSLLPLPPLSFPGEGRAVASARSGSRERSFMVLEWGDLQPHAPTRPLYRWAAHLLAVAVMGVVISVHQQLHPAARNFIVVVMFMF